MGTITRKGIKGLIKHVVLFTLVAAGIITTSILVYEFGPSPTIYQDGWWGNYRYYPPAAANITPTAPEKLVLLDQHSHTVYADGELTPQQSVQWHYAMGYNACVISDHRTVQGSIDARNYARQYYNDTFKVLLGGEYSNDRIHMNIIGISDKFMQYFLAHPPISLGSSDADIKAFIDAAHANDGLVVVNHIVWSLNQGMDHPTRDELLAWGVDYIEVINDDENYDNESMQFCAANGIGQITGTDRHGPGFVKSWTGINVTDFTEEAIFEELKAHRTALLYNASGSPYDFPGGDRNPAYVALLPFMYLGEMFEWLYDGDLDWPGIAVFLAYAFGAFFIAEGVRYRLKKRGTRDNPAPTPTVPVQ